MNARSIYDPEFGTFAAINNFAPHAPGSVDYAISVAWMIRAALLIGALLFVVDLSQDDKYLIQLWVVLGVAAGSISLLGLLQKATGAQAILWQTPIGHYGSNFFATYYYHANAGAFLNLVLPLTAGLAVRAFGIPSSPGCAIDLVDHVFVKPGGGRREHFAHGATNRGPHFTGAVCATWAAGVSGIVPVGKKYVSRGRRRDSISGLCDWSGHSFGKARSQMGAIGRAGFEGCALVGFADSVKRFAERRCFWIWAGKFSRGLSFFEWRSSCHRDLAVFTRGLSANRNRVGMGRERALGFAFLRRNGSSRFVFAKTASAPQRSEVRGQRTAAFAKGYGGPRKSADTGC